MVEHDGKNGPLKTRSQAVLYQLCHGAPLMHRHCPWLRGCRRTRVQEAPAVLPGGIVDRWNAAGGRVGQGSAR